MSAQAESFRSVRFCHIWLVALWSFSEGGTVSGFGLSFCQM